MASSSKSAGPAFRYEVFCDCQGCRDDDPVGRGQMVAQSVRTHHLKQQSIYASQIAKRARGRDPIRMSPSPMTLRGIQARGRGIPSTIPGPIRSRGQMRGSMGRGFVSQRQSQSHSQAPRVDEDGDIQIRSDHSSPPDSPDNEQMGSPLFLPDDPPNDDDQLPLNCSPSPNQLDAPSPIRDSLPIIPDKLPEPLRVPNPVIEHHAETEGRQHSLAVPASSSDPSNEPPDLPDLLDGEDDDLDDDDAILRTSHQPTPAGVSQLAEPVQKQRSFQQIYDGSHSLWFVRVILVLIAALHSRYRLPFRGCALALICLGLLFSSLRLVPEDEPIPRTLDTVLKRLNLQDCFKIHPTCGTCRQVFSPSIPTDTKCGKCDLTLFRPAASTLFAQIRNQKPPPPIPKVAVPIRILSEALPDFLNRGDNERSCEAWRSHTSVPGVYEQIWDGDVWKTIQGPDNKLWFDPTTDTTELRLGVTISIDW